MKKTTGNKIRLGVFVSVSLALFIAGLYFIGQRQQLFSSTFRVSGVFKDINGLQVGNNVRYSGINVGIIENIEQISDSTVRVDMMIVEQTRKFLKKDAKAIIGSDGLMGNKIVVILPGTSGQPQIADNDILETTRAVTMDDILVKIKTTSENAESITGDLAAIMQNLREGRGTIGKLFVDSVFAQTVDDALVNIKQGAGSFKQNMEAAKHNVFLKGFFKKKDVPKKVEEKKVRENDPQKKEDPKKRKGLFGRKKDDTVK